MLTLQAFLALDPTTLASPIGTCCVCHKPITGIHPDDVKTIGDDLAHDDCYQQELGNLVEAHPPGRPRR